MREFTLTDNVSFPSQCHQKIQNMIRSCCSNILYAIVVFHFIVTVRQKLMSLPSEGCRFVRRFVCAGTATTGTFTSYVASILVHDVALNYQHGDEGHLLIGHPRQSTTMSSDEVVPLPLQQLRSNKELLLDDNPIAQ